MFKERTTSQEVKLCRLLFRISEDVVVQQVYLRCISGYEKGVCATGVVIVVHCSCYIKGHELQGWDVPGQAAVAVV